MTTMVSGNTLAQTGALIGDPARANILLALMDGRALTAGELAWHAGVSAQTTSGHLGKLVEAQLVGVVRQGRHRYHRLASTEVARAVEALSALAAAGPVRHRPTGPRDEALRVARTCYDHLAGRLAVATGRQSVRERASASSRDADGRCRRGHRSGSRASWPASSGSSWVRRPARRPLCRTCLDWSERRPHLAGRLGAALCRRSLELGWIAAMPYTRAVAITPLGRQGFTRTFGLDLA